MSFAAVPRSEPAALAGSETVGKGRRALLLCAVLCLAFGAGIFDHDVWSPTEPTVAGVVSGMVRTGDLLIPRIHGIAYLEKPPLVYGLAWLCARLAGHLDAGVLRLPSALFGLSSLALVWWTSRRFHGEAVAWACALLGATCFSLFEVFHRACTDSAAIFFAFLGFAIFAVSLHPETAGDPRRVRRSDILLALALALSFYAKNFYTLLVVLPPVALFLVWKRRTTRLLRLLLALGVLLVLTVGPWVLAVYRAGGWPYLRIVFVDNTMGRFLDLRAFARGMEGPLNDAYSSEKEFSPLVYLRALVYLPLPWTPLLAVALVRVLATGRESELRSFLKLTWMTMPVVLSFSSSKVGLYLAPILWVYLLAGGEWLADLSLRRPSLRRAGLLVLGANLGLFWILLLSAPVVGWRIYGDPRLLLALIPVGGIAVAVWLSRTRDRGGAIRLATHGAALGIGFAIVFAALVPSVNEERSYRDFFETIRPELEGLELCTTLQDDLRLPLLEYYADRPFEILDSSSKGFEKLRGTAPVGLFLPAGDYEASKSALSDLSCRVLRGRRGKQPLVLVVNHAALVRESREHRRRSGP